MLDVDAPKIISKMQKERDVEGLVKVLKLDLKDGYVAWAATKLGEIGDGRAVGPLISALRDTNWRVREGAEEALIEIRGAIAAT